MDRSDHERHHPDRTRRPPDQRDHGERTARDRCCRISVNGGGCSGFQYAFDVDRTRQDDDLVVEKDGATVLVDEVSIQYIDGSVIDFVDDLMGQSFKIENPHATASCGCGTSFSL